MNRDDGGRRMFGVNYYNISASRPLGELADVHRLSEAGRIRGKVIIIP